MKQVALLLAFITSALVAQDLSSSYPKGKGSRFILDIPEAKDIELLVYVTESSKNRVGIEMSFSTSQIGIPLQLWEQTILEVRGEQVVPAENFLMTNLMMKPEKFSMADIGASEGLQISEFVMINRDKLKKNLIGTEQVKTPAGTVTADHYRQTKDGQTFDFWISDDAKPIGLVKLQATGKQKFGLLLGSLIKNVERKIDPAKAVPLSAQGKLILGVKTPIKMQ